MRLAYIFVFAVMMLAVGCAQAPKPTPGPASAPTQQTEPAGPAKPPTPVQQAPASGPMAEPVARWTVVPDQRWWATADSLIRLQEDLQTLEAVETDGATVRWTLKCGGEFNNVVWEEAGRRAVAFTDEKGCLFDPATGALLGTVPPAAERFALGGFAWRGDFMAFGSDPKLSPGPGPVAYFGTDWTVYHLEPGADGRLEAKPLYNTVGADPKEPGAGSRKAALSADGHTLLSWFGNHGAGRPRLFRDGKLITKYERDINSGPEFALDPRDDRFYLLAYNGLIEAHSLEGKLLWQQPAYKCCEPHLWAVDGAVLIAVWYREEGVAAVYSDQGALLWTADGIPLQTAGPYLLTRATNEMHLLDRTGHLAARYPPETYLTGDRKALARLNGDQVELYRLP